MRLTEVSERIRAAHGGTVWLVEATYRGFKARATFVDKDYGEWVNFVYAVAKGQRHPDRARLASRTPWTEVQTRLDSIFGVGLITVLEESYEKFSQECRFVDAEFGVFEAYPKNVLKGKGHPKRGAASRTQKRLAGDVVQRVLEASSGKVRLIGPYQGMLTKCLFFDTDHGEFSAYPVNVIHHGTRHTHGAGARRRITYLEEHWETGLPVVCVASYERRVVQWFSTHRVRYLWQATTFPMPDGRTYRPDAYLPDRDLWIEIKGYFWQHSGGKWDWFHNEHPNSELWDEAKLKELGILPSKRVK